MRKLLLRLTGAILLLGAIWPSLGDAQPTPALLRPTLGRALNYSVVVVQKGSGILVLMGTIDANMATDFRHAVAADPTLHTLVIDSYGGNIEQAMDMAELMRTRKMRLVVDGRCLSACANYLFPAAARKSVLPGSVVAIHGLSYEFLDNGKLKQLSQTQAADLFHSSRYASDGAAWERALAREAAFYRQLGMSGASFDTFKHYLAHRKQLFGTDQIDAQQQAPGCRPFQMWALNQAQLESMGVRGIEQFWYPSTDEQRRQLSQDLAMPADFFYYGPGAQLEQLCTQTPPLQFRLARWLASVKSAFSK